MTIATIKDLPILSVRFTGRDASVGGVVLINKETNQEVSTTRPADWYIDSSNTFHIDLRIFPEFVDDIKKSTSLSILMYGSVNKPVYKDLVRFFSTIDTDISHSHDGNGTEYIFLDDE